LLGEDQMLEPDVTITDYLLAAECLCFAIVLYHRSASVPWLLLFGSLSAASLAGGTVHGFFPDESSLAHAFLWRMSLIAIGGMALAGWYVGSAFLQNRQVAGWIKKGAVLQFILFSVVILFHSQAFLIAAVNYLPAAIFLLIIFMRGYLRTKRKALLLGAASIVLTFMGSFVQIAHIPLHPVYFNHNALYHAIQFIAVCLLFAAAWCSTKGKEPYAK
jgi:hypothetical protein